MASNVQDLYQLGRDGETLEYLLSAAPERAIRMVQSGYVTKPRAYLATAIRNAKAEGNDKPSTRRTEADTSNPGCQTASCLGKPINARTTPRCRLGSSPKAQNASEDSLRGPPWSQRKDLGHPYQRLPSALLQETRDLKVAKTRLSPCAPSRGKRLTTATF